MLSLLIVLKTLSIEVEGNGRNKQKAVAVSKTMHFILL